MDLRLFLCPLYPQSQVLLWLKGPDQPRISGRSTSFSHPIAPLLWLNNPTDLYNLTSVGRNSPRKGTALLPALFYMFNTRQMPVPHGSTQYFRLQIPCPIHPMRFPPIPLHPAGSASRTRSIGRPGARSIVWGAQAAQIVETVSRRGSSAGENGLQMWGERVDGPTTRGLSTRLSNRFTKPEHGSREVAQMPSNCSEVRCFQHEIKNPCMMASCVR